MFDRFKNRNKLMEKVEFEIKLVHDKPVDLIQMANSLIALNNIAQAHISKEHGVKDSKILLNGVKNGCDIYQVALDLGTAALPMLDGISSIKDVLDYISSYKNINKKTVEELRDNRHYNTVDAENIQKFVSPVINNDDNSNIQINVGGDVNAPIVIINQEDAKQMMENANFVKRVTSDQEIKEDNKTHFEKVLIKMHKAIDSTKKVKDSSYCDDIVKGKSVSTVIENEEDKKEVLANAFTSLFLVDIEVSKADGEVKLYRVTKLHNIVPIDEE